MIIKYLSFQVAEAKKQASVLESYLEQRGVALPEGYFSYKVVIPNPKFRYVLNNFIFFLFFNFKIFCKSIY